MIDGYYWYFSDEKDEGDFTGPPQIVEIIDDKIYMIGCEWTYHLAEALGKFLSIPYVKEVI